MRAVENEQELRYIASHEVDIERVIKKHNAHSEILYLIPTYLKMPERFSSRHFILDLHGYQGDTREGLRSLFDFSEELQAYLLANYDGTKRKLNLLWDYQHEESIGNVGERKKCEQRTVRLIEKRNKDFCHEREGWANIGQKMDQLLALLNTDFARVTLPERIALYGFGQAARIVYTRIKARTSVVCFIDKEPSATCYEDVPVVPLAKYSYAGETILVFPTQFFEEIQRDLLARGVPREKICRAEELFPGGDYAPQKFS